MKSLAVVAAAMLVTVGAANAGEIVGAVNAGEIVINPKASDSAVVLTIREGKVVKASVITKPEPMAKPKHLEDTPAFARTP
jgi:hypothetical protein